MNAATRACAPSGVTWDGINWADVQRQVRGLQARIVKATQDGRHNKAKALQWLLTHSFSGKASAVKRVTENKGQNTPGVDLTIAPAGLGRRFSLSSGSQSIFWTGARPAAVKREVVE
jgi:N-terminal domain of reverse transcriptase